MALVLSRSVGERVRIDVGGVHVWVMVADVWDGRVRLAFNAPKDVVVLREELVDRPDVTPPGGGR